MDALWEILRVGLNHLQAGLFQIISPLHVFGPTVTIAVLAALTALLAGFLTRRYKTRRYRMLEQEFIYWYQTKQAALRLKAAEPEKAGQMGVNIDKAKLNEAYYNYFFEGLLNNLLTLYMPVFFMLAFVNEIYRPAALAAMFGKTHLFTLFWINGQAYPIGAGFWFVCCILAAFLVFWGFGRIGPNMRRYLRPVKFIFKGN